MAARVVVVQDLHSRLVTCPRMSIEQSADQFVVRIAGIAKVDEEFPGGIDGLCITADQPFHFRAGWFRARDSGEAGQRGNILAEVRSRAEIVIPAAHVLSRRRQPGTLPVDLQHAILAQIQKERMILVELPLERAVQQFDGAVRKYRQIRNRSARLRPGFCRGGNGRADRAPKKFLRVRSAIAKPPQ